MIDQGEEGTYDFAFIDAGKILNERFQKTVYNLQVWLCYSYLTDKPNYCNYFELCLKLLRPGGIITIDNVLFGGAVINEEAQVWMTHYIRSCYLSHLM